MSVALAAVAAGVIAFTFAGETSAPESARLSFTQAPATPSPTPAATAIPRTWLDAVGAMPFGRPPMLLTCLDRDNNDVLDGTDDALFFGVALPLSVEDACVNPVAHADYFDAVAPPDFRCGAEYQPVYLVVIGGGGSNLLDTGAGDSVGLTRIINGVRDRAEVVQMRITLTLSSGAIIGAEMAQTSLEQLLSVHLSARLEALPCARAVLVGHSHGGVTVTSLTAALDDRFSDRVLGVLVDRSSVLYDRPADNMPTVTRIINVFQTNEGWHGEALERPNVTDINASAAIAPIAAHDGGGGPATVTHRSLDDSPAVQARIVEEILAWLQPR